MTGKKLSAEQKKILFEKATEPPFSGAYYHHREKGRYHCASCGKALFSSAAKYDGLKCFVPGAAVIWGIFSRMAQSPRACVIASIR